MNKKCPYCHSRYTCIGCHTTLEIARGRELDEIGKSIDLLRSWTLDENGAKWQTDVDYRESIKSARNIRNAQIQSVSRSTRVLHDKISVTILDFPEHKNSSHVCTWTEKMGFTQPFLACTCGKTKDIK